MFSPIELYNLEDQQEFSNLADSFTESDRINRLLKKSHIDFANEDIQRDLAMSIFEENNFY